MYPYSGQAANSGVVGSCNQTIIGTSLYQNSKFSITGSQLIAYRDC